MSSTGERVWFVWLTALDEDTDHAVTDEEMAAGGSAGPGRYRGMCGAVFLPAPMERAPGMPCPRCAAVVLDRIPPADGSEQRRHRWCRTRRHGRRRPRTLRKEARR